MKVIRNRLAALLTGVMAYGLLGIDVKPAEAGQENLSPVDWCAQGANNFNYSYAYNEVI